MEDSVQLLLAGSAGKKVHKLVADHRDVETFHQQCGEEQMCQERCRGTSAI
jgi:hypothetical protein